MGEEARKLAREDISRVWVDYQKDKNRDLQDVLIRHYLPLVRYIAERLAERLPRNVQVDDLVSAGVMGLMEAVERFDPRRGVKFESYFSRRVKGAMLDELRAMDWVPRVRRQRVNRLEHMFQRLEQDLGRTPSDEEMAQALGVSERELNELYRDYNSCTLYSMQKSSGQEDAQVGIEAVQDRRARDPFSVLAKKDLVEIVKRQLSTKERYILMLYYQEELTMKDIGEILGLSESRVSQVHAKMMLKLRTAIKRKVNPKEVSEE